MARPKDPSPPLKAKLARLARRIVRDGGADALTMRAAAEEAGVSPNAPAIHYPGGAAELLAEVAIGAFDDLRGELNRAPVALDPVERVRALVERYVEFGVRHPELYRAMFHSRLIPGLSTVAQNGESESTFARLADVKELAYQDLLAPLYQMEARGSLRGDDPRDAPGLALAALAHGIVGEFIDEGLVHPGPDADPWSDDRRATALEMTDVLLFGVLSESAPLRASAGASCSLAPSEDPSWHHYSQTILEFFPGDRAISVDLRESIADAIRERLYARGLPAQFAVLTAQNPRGRTVSDDENARLDRALKERLRLAGQVWVPVDGHSPDGRHREAGIAVGLDREQAIALAREFGQSALFSFDGEEAWLVGALVDTTAVQLPVASKMRKL